MTVIEALREIGAELDRARQLHPEWPTDQIHAAASASPRTPIAGKNDAPAPALDPNQILFSTRNKITKMITDWYDAHPEIPINTFNTVTVLNKLGLLKHPDPITDTATGTKRK